MGTSLGGEPLVVYQIILGWQEIDYLITYSPQLPRINGAILNIITILPQTD